MKIKTNLNDYFLVKEKITNKLFATLKSDTPLGKWKDLLDKSVKCIPVTENGELDKMHEIEIKREDLDTGV